VHRGLPLVHDLSRVAPKRSSLLAAHP
jgi:hypothetical protein